MEIGNRKIGTEKGFFIVEEGQLNQGDFSKAIKMIDIAANVGADAIEFQFAIADDFYVRDHRGHEIYQKVQFSIDEISALIRHSKEKNIELVSAPLSHNLIEPLVKAGTSAFNINASDINNPQMLEMVAKSGLPFFLSLPLASEKEIDWAINNIEKHSSNYILLHGQHTMASGEFGVDPVHSSLGFINTIKKKYTEFAGYIDHSPLVWMPSCAVAAGADVISKHICISHEDKGPDWRVCLNPEEMREAISFSRQMWKSINTKDKVLAPGENIDKSKMRRSIVSAKKIYAKNIITIDDIAFKRPGTGITSSEIDSVIGKTAKNDIQADTLISKDDIE